VYELLVKRVIVYTCLALNNIGQAYVEKGMSAEAISVLEECLAFQYSFLRADHPVIGTALWNLGAAYKAQNDVMKATEVWKQCLSVREKCLPSTHPGLLDGKPHCVMN
jgi:tetratricopeptide (TPR) repeat protein